MLKTFRYGFIMDLSAAAYLSFFPVIVLLFSSVVRSSILYTILLMYSILVIIAASLLGILDIGLYSEWGMRLNTQILPALENPRGMLACVTNIQLVVLILVEIAMVTGFVFLYRFLFKSNKKQEKQKWWSFFIVLFLMALLVIPVRGGLQLTPINFSHVYFSSKQIANHTAINPYWSFFYRLINNEAKVKEVTLIDEHLSNTIIHNFLTKEQEDIPIFIKPKNNQQVNVIVIILEFFSNKVIEPLGGVPGITPNFNKLAKEGILFNNFYASGNRSDKGIAALLAAYPTLIGPYSILYFPEKMENLDFLTHYFNKNNYQTHFYYAGEADFYNTKTLVLHSNFNHLVSVTDFPSSAKQQKWGIPDHLFYERVVTDIKTFTSPFFLVTYNISSHPPYDIPGISKRDYKNAITYSDQQLGGFVKQLRETPFWDNTLLIITSDHGTKGFTETSISNPLSHQIPMLWIGGVIDTSFVNENIGNQTDLTATLVQQLGWNYTSNPFSKNLFGKSSFAFYFNPNGYGFISQELGYYNDIDVDRIDFLYGNPTQKKDSLLQFSKAFVQYLHSDFKKR
jgi:phosphoglycerol transferase MdoB-like AlkP superfamily enzyme